MAYIGNKPGAKYATLTRQTFSTPTGTSHTLSQTVTNSDDLLLYINNVKQNPADYTASGTTLTTASLAGGTEMYCLYYGKTTETVAVPSDSVDSSHIVDDAIDSEHYTDGSIDNVHLATGIDAAKLTTGTLPIARIADDAITLAKMAPGTDGNIISYDASGNPVAIATGNDGQVLTSTGAGSPPAFEASSVCKPYYSVTGGNQNVTDAVTTKMTFSNETSDSDGLYDSSTNYRFTPNKAGRYFIMANLQFSPQNKDIFHSCSAHIYKNGSNSISISEDDFDNYYSYSKAVSISGMMEMNGTTDYIEIYGNLNVVSGSPQISGGVVGFYCGP